MVRLALAWGTSVVLTSSVLSATAQAPEQAGAGAALYAARCADCHGADATGISGPDLTRLWTSSTPPNSEPLRASSAAVDERVFLTIKLGVAGSIMPPSAAPDAEIRAMVAYLKSLGAAPPTAPARGNADHGQQIFWSTCGTCHRVNQRGGRLGPDLSAIARSQSRAALRRAIREPSASIAAGYQAVTVITRDGQQIRGVRKGEDAFSVQILDTRERLQGYLKADVRDVTRDARSLMPDYGPDRLSESDLDDLLQFLGTLGGLP